MQHGIGRAGYRLLATVLFAIGVLGLAMTWYAAVVDGSKAFVHMGLGLGGVGLLWLFFFTFVLSHEPKIRVDAEPRPARRRLRRKKADEARPDVAPAAPASAGGFEYSDAKPAPRAAPESLVLPKAFEGGGPAGAEAAPPAPAASAPAAPAPAAPAPAGGPAEEPETTDFLVVEETAGTWPPPRGDHPRAPAASPPKPAHDGRGRLTERYTRATPTVRNVLQEVRTVTAKRVEGDFDPDWAPKGAVRGRCSKCETVILAPTARPVRVACPECGHTKLLE